VRRRFPFRIKFFSDLVGCVFFLSQHIIMFIEVFFLLCVPFEERRGTERGELYYSFTGASYLKKKF